MNIKSNLSFYTRYDRLGASSRIRFLQFIPKLQKYYQINTYCLLPNEYIFNLYSGKKQNKLMMLGQYIKRFWQIVTDKSECVIIEKELFPFLPYWVEKTCLANKKYIIDIDDAVFLNYERSQNPIKKYLLQNKFKQLFANSHAVLAGSPYLQEKALQSGAKNVIYYPTVIEWDNYAKRSAAVSSTDNTVVIGWIGNNSTIKYLELILDPLAQVAALNLAKLKLCVIGAKLDLVIKDVEIEYIPWSEQSEIASINALDIGIMPLQDSDWERGKCAYKLIQYMACGKPVIASSIGANNVVVLDNENGYLCADLQGWFTAFKNLIQDAKLRETMGHAGLVRVKNNYTVDSNIMRLTQVLEKSN